ncbi:MAG: hypothetical protein WBF43_13110 [Methylocella sp.]
MDGETDERRAKYVGRFYAGVYLRTIYGLSISETGLARRAVIGNGPPFRMAGRDAIYEIADLDAWAESLIGPKVHSTSGLPPRDCRKTAGPRR